MPGKNELYIVEKISRILEDTYRHLAIQSLTLSGQGMDFLVFRAFSPVYKEVAIKVPKKRYIANKNDPFQDSFELLKQEEHLMNYLRDHDIPVPRVVLLHEDKNEDFLPFLICEYISSDRSAVDFTLLGQITSKIHQAPPPPFTLVAQEGKPWEELLPQRTVRRLNLIRELAPLDGLPCEEELQERLISSVKTSGKCLVHLDLRPENLLLRQTRIAAVVDWANAILAHPIVEFTRLHEYGLLNREFLEGYGDHRFFQEADPTVKAIGYLDTAAMLSLVFLSEAPDKKLAEHWVGRTNSLINRLSKKHKHYNHQY